MHPQMCKVQLPATNMFDLRIQCLLKKTAVDHNAHLCRANLSTADISRSVAPAMSPRYLSSTCLHPQRMVLPSSSQPSTSSIFIPANTSSHSGMSTLLQLPHSTSIASQQSSDSSSTVIASQMHFLPGMSNHTPPLSFAPGGVGYPIPVGGGFPTPTGGANQMIAGEMLVPIAGPSRTAVEEVPCNQGSGTGKKKGKGAAAKKADMALDAPKGDCYHWTCSNPSEIVTCCASGRTKTPQDNDC